MANSSKQYIGQLFRGNPATKEWTAIGGGPQTLRILSEEGKWKLQACNGQERVWETCLDSSFKHRLRENFVQWQKQQQTGVIKDVYGFKIKETSLAQEFSDALTVALSKSPSSLPLESLPSSEKMLKILLPSKEYLTMTFNTELTMVQVMRKVAAHKNLEVSYFALGISPDTPGGGAPLVLKPTLTVGELKTFDLVVVRRQKSVREKTKVDESPPTLSIEVTLLSGDKRSYSVPPTILLPDLVTLVCGDTGLSPVQHQFDLPIQNQEKIKLHQLRVTALTLIKKESNIEEDKIRAEATDGDGRGGGDLKTRSPRSKKIAPPPPVLSTTTKQITSQLIEEFKFRQRSDSSPSTLRHRTHDVNDDISSLLSQQAIGNTNPPGLRFSPHTGKRNTVPATRVSSQDSPKVKRVAPPPPKAIHKKEDQDMTDYPQQKLPPYLGVPLPSMVRRQTAPHDQQTKPLQDKVSISPNLGRRGMLKKQPVSLNSSSPPPSPKLTNSPQKLRKPTRKAPTKPKPHPPSLPQTQEITTQSQVPTKSSEETNKERSSPTLAKSSEVPVIPAQVPENKVVVMSSSSKHTPLTLSAPIVFKIPPPPPPKKIQQNPVVQPILEVVSQDDDHKSNRSSVTSESSSVCDYDINETNHDTSPPKSPTSSEDDDMMTDEKNDGEREELEEVDFDMPKVWNKAEETHKISVTSLPPEPVSDDDEVTEEGGGIVLLKHEQNVIEEVSGPSLLPSVDPVIEEALHELTNIRPTESFDDSEYNMSGNLKELDSMVASLRTLIADTCEISGTEGPNEETTTTETKPKFDLTYIKDMAPPPDSSMPSSEAPPPPPPPPPPPTGTKKAPPPIVKPKPPRKPLLESSLTKQNELQAKLAHQQLKINEQLTDNVSKNKPSSIPPPPPPPPPSISPSAAAAAPSSVPPSSIHSPQVETSNDVTGGDHVQVQLQMLQQQMLQQQMMQLQQQFQQLQQMMMSQTQLNPALMQSNMSSFPVMPGQIMAGQVMPGQIMPGQIMAGQVMPGQIMPGQVMPGQVMPGQIMAGKVVPGQVIPGQIPTMLMSGALSTGSLLSIQQSQSSTTPIMTTSILGENTAIPNDSTFIPNIVPPPPLVPPAVFPTSTSIAGVVPPLSTAAGIPSVPAGILPSPPLSTVPQDVPHPASIPRVVQQEETLIPSDVSPKDTLIPSEAPPTVTSVLPQLATTSTPEQSSKLSLPTKEDIELLKMSSDVRSSALGQIEDKFDNLMDEVREVDLGELLNKISEEDNEPTSAYTGMAAALVEAMKERRKHFGSTSLNASSVSNSSQHDNPENEEESITEWRDP